MYLVLTCTFTTCLHFLDSHISYSIIKAGLMEPYQVPDQETAAILLIEREGIIDHKSGQPVVASV